MPCVSSCLLILSHVPLDSRASFLAVKVLRAVWLLVVESCRIDYGGVRPCHVRALGQAPKRGPRPRSSGALCGCIHLHPVLMSCRLSPPHVDVLWHMCPTDRSMHACTHTCIRTARPMRAHTRCTQVLFERASVSNCGAAWHTHRFNRCGGRQVRRRAVSGRGAWCECGDHVTGEARGSAQRRTSFLPRWPCLVSCPPHARMHVFIFARLCEFKWVGLK